jgi:5-methylcytosine-specific restriction endonuclease McrA
MLFPYTYVPHRMETMNAFIDFIFVEVWCKAPTLGEFELSLFDTYPDLKELMEKLLWSDAAGADFFYGHVERIYGLFKGLTAAQTTELEEWYKNNNAIEQICQNDPTINIARYADVRVAHPYNARGDVNASLFKQLASFFKGLYSQSLLNLTAVKEKVGNIDDHYKTFMTTNTLGKCPFCGISDVLGIYHTKREAYDHYLPKSLYPFNSLNFKNLVPACHHCNSSYKTTIDPAYTPTDPAGEVHRRKAFYPYSLNPYVIGISIGITATHVDNISTDDIQLSFEPANLNEEIETWKNVYDIEERYKAKCCSETDGKAWINRVIEERRNYDCSIEKMLDAEIKTANNQPYSDSNFLKKAFLNGCNEAGIFNEIPNE